MSITFVGDLSFRPEGRSIGCALIAVKQRARCKTRLSNVLAPSARIELVRKMLAAALSAANDARTIGQVIVLSPERDDVPSDVPVLTDSGECLNSALADAHRLLRELGFQELVVLPADLPTISGADIDCLVHAGRAGGFAIAPDSAGMGTNALFISSAQPFRYRFGPDSRRLHMLEAERIGLVAEVVYRDGLQFDVDSAADLGRLEEQQWHTRHLA